MSVIPHESIVHNVTQTAKSEVNGITKLPTSSFELVLSVQTQQHGVKGSELLDRHCCPSDKSTSKKRLENSSRNPSQSPNKPALCPSPASSSCPAVRQLPIYFFVPDGFNVRPKPDGKFRYPRDACPVSRNRFYPLFRRTELDMTSLSVSGDNRSLLPVTAEEGSDKRLAS